MQRMAYALAELMEHHKRFAYRICAPNLRVSNTYRPAEGSYPLVFAEISAHVKSEVKEVVHNLQLTVDDVTCYDHGMEMSMLADEVGRYAFTPQERVHLSEQFALVKRGDTRSPEQELENLRSRQSSLLAERRDVQCLPEAKSRVKTKEEIPSGIAMIIRKLKNRSDFMISHGGNYTHWTEELKISLESFAKENQIEWGLFLVSLGARWGTEIFVRTHDISCETAQKYSAIMRKMTIGELLAMFYAVGTMCFNQGPIPTLGRLFVEVNPNRLFTMLVLARRLVKNIIDLLALISNKSMDEAFVLALDREDLIYNWIYSALVDTSGLLEGPKETDWDAPGFFFPHQIAAITNTEVRDLMVCSGLGDRSYSWILPCPEISGNPSESCCHAKENLVTLFGPRDGTQELN